MTLEKYYWRLFNDNGIHDIDELKSHFKRFAELKAKHSVELKKVDVDEWYGWYYKCLDCEAYFMPMMNEPKYCINCGGEVSDGN